MTKSASDGPSTRFLFTRDSVDRAVCPPGKAQALYWDTAQPGLGLRVTKAGARSFIFETKLGRQTIRMTIGAASMQIRSPKDSRGRPKVPSAADQAVEWGALVVKGIDPRAERAERIRRHAEERDQARVEQQRLEVTGLDAWEAYCTDRAPHWSPRNLADHRSLVKAGGAQRKRGEGQTVDGPLRALLKRPLGQIDAAAVEQWVTAETKKRPARAALGFRQLRAFINWCSEHADFRLIAQLDACKGRRARERLAKPKAKSDSLQREQLAPWFDQVRRLPPVVSSYLQALLLTGARREEMANLQWSDVDFQWRTLRLRDKVEGERTIPLPPYLASVLFALRGSKVPKPGAWVFASGTAASGRITEPRIAHNRAIELAGLPHLTLHGLRRSFGTLAEWVEMPTGIAAQIQGHKPSATAEKHYRVRPIDLLRLWHTKLEAWMLAESRVDFDAEAAEAAMKAPPARVLRVVAGRRAA